MKQVLKEGKKEENNENNVVDVVQDDLLFACDKDIINFVSQDTSWIVDSRATWHVTPRKDFFSFYTFVNSEVLKMGNAGEVKVFGVDTVCLKINTGSTLALKNVKHAPDIPWNLISVGQLNDDSYHNDLFNDQWKLTKAHWF